MGKKVIDVGAPAYMAQYTALMTILLAFFILLTTMKDEQESGYDSGIGDVKNAFGSSGGFGLFQFTYYGSGGGNPPNPKTGANDTSLSGFDECLVKGSGGSGNTEIDTKDSDSGKYVIIKLPYSFKKNEDTVTSEMADYLKRFATGMIINETYSVNIKCFANNDRRGLATRRSAQIMRRLHAVGGISYSRLQATGYANHMYFSKEEETEDEATYFYIFVEK